MERVPPLCAALVLAVGIACSPRIEQRDAGEERSSFPDAGGGGEVHDGGTDAGTQDPLEDEYGACARGCPEERPFCTPAGSCSACEEGGCDNNLVFGRDLAGGFAPLAATAWAGEVRVGGVIADGLDLGTGPLATEHLPGSGRTARGDLYLATLSAEGDALQAETLRTSGGARVLGLEHLGKRVLIHGEFGSELDLRGQVVTEASTLGKAGFVALFEAEGHLAWHLIFEAGNADLLDATFLEDGDILISGLLGRGQSVDFGACPLTATNTNGDSFLARIGPEGQCRFSRLLAEGTTRPHAVQGVPGGGFVVAGALGRDTDFGGGVLSNDSSYATFVARYDAAGQHLWSKRYPEPGSNFIDMRSSHLAVAHDGAIVFGAKCGGTLDFEGGGQLVVEGHFSPCVFSLDAQGGYRSGLVLPSTSGAQLWGLRVDPWGQPVLLADFDGPLVVSGETFTPVARTAVVIRTDPGNMAPNFMTFIEGGTAVNATALAVSSDGAIFAAGWHGGSLHTPNGVGSAVPGIFLMRWGK